MFKKAFTLIELMIVLAIIAILAAVLIPKAVTFKTEAKNAGVVTNVKTIRCYLEPMAVYSSYDSDDAKEIQTKLKSTFTIYNHTENIDNALYNPFTGKIGYMSNNIDYLYYTGTKVNNINHNYLNGSFYLAIFDCTVKPKTTTQVTVPSVLDNSTLGKFTKDNQGVTFVYIYSDGIVVFGLDNNNSVIGAQVIK
ncbi:MAG: type II secretion system protein [Clostridiaceae bacterium]